MKQSFWTPERDQALIAYWQHGRDVQDIGEKLQCSKGAVAGRIFRLRQRGVELCLRPGGGPERPARRHVGAVEAINWTKEANERLATAWNDGASALDLSQEFDCSRSAVLSQIDRLRKAGVLLRHQQPKRQQKVRVAPTPVASVFNVSAHRGPAPLNLPFSALRPGFTQCRWPTNAENKQPTFCGHPVTYRSYCQCHARIAYREYDRARVKILEAAE